MRGKNKDKDQYKYHIINYEYICTGNIVAWYVMNCKNEGLANKIISGLNNINLVMLTDKFILVDTFRRSQSDNYMYFVVENSLGAFIVREDNIKLIKDKTYTLRSHGYKQIIRSGDRTILVHTNGSKTITTKLPEDDDDQEKAIMICLLKDCGYTMQYILDLVDIINKNS